MIDGLEVSEAPADGILFAVQRTVKDVILGARLRTDLRCPSPSFVVFFCHYRLTTSTFS